MKYSKLSNFTLPIITFILILPVPSLCYADGVSPLINFFSEETYKSATIVLLCIILFESFILWRSIKTASYVKHLLFSTIINVISSAAGSLLILASGRNKFYFWDTTPLVFPLFLITLIVEFPSIKLLYKDAITWKRSIWINFKINMFSYLLVFVIQLSLLYGFLYFANCKDKQIAKKWTHSEILKQEKGFIYTISKGDNYYLKRYNIKENKWENMKKRYIWPLTWSVSKNTLAAIVSTSIFERDKHVTIFKLPEFSKVCIIPGQYDDIKVDPSGKYVALLKHFSSVVSQKDSESYYIFGEKTKLNIYSADSCKKNLTYDEFILDDGIDWSPESNKILFVSFRDKSLFIPEVSNMKGGTSYGRPDLHPKYVYVYDLKTNSIAEIFEGIQPRWSHDGERILFIKKGKVFIYSLATKSAEILIEAKADKYGWSPSDKNLIAMLPQYQPFGASELLTVINIQNPELKFIIEPKGLYDFEWTK